MVSDNTKSKMRYTRIRLRMFVRNDKIYTHMIYTFDFICKLCVRENF